MIPFFSFQVRNLMLFDRNGLSYVYKINFNYAFTFKFKIRIAGSFNEATI